MALAPNRHRPMAVGSRCPLLPCWWDVALASGMPPDSTTVDDREQAADSRRHSGHSFPIAVSGSRLTSRSPVFLGAALVGLTVVVAACGGGSGAPTPAPGFYSTPSPPTARPGTLLRYQALGVHIAGAHAYRILYVSDSSGGSPRTSGGVVVVPETKPPANGRAIVAWAHPVVGDNAAPSRSTNPLSAMDPWISRAVGNGWIVVATDFVGVGTHRQESFVGQAEANDIAYSVLAVRHLPRANGGSAWVAFGESSGGHGALWSGSLAPALTPGLQLLGVAAVAPVAELVPVEQAEGKPWAPSLLAQTPVPLKPSIPAFIAEGTHDTVVPAATTALLQRQWCSAGSTLYVDWLNGVTHDGSTAAAASEAVSWIEHRFGGSVAPDNCSVDPPVAPSSG